MRRTIKEITKWFVDGVWEEDICIILKVYYAISILLLIPFECLLYGIICLGSVLGIITLNPDEEVDDRDLEEIKSMADLKTLKNLAKEELTPI